MARNFLCTALTLLVLALVIAVIPTERDGAIYEDTVRLHILASSDKAEDQSLKLLVRDKLLEKYSEALSSAKTKDAATEKISTILKDIENDVRGWVGDAGYDYSASVSLGREWFERRSYGEYSLPEGYYTSLIVELGEARGQNWWCVMYPPLCLDIATESAPKDDAVLGYTDEELSLIAGSGYTVRFKILELASEIFAGRGRRS